MESVVLSSDRKPDFLVIGSQKSGTSSLFQVLRRHPDVFVPEVKEVNYYFWDHIYARGPAWYGQQFATAKLDALCGDMSPGYICHPRSPERIYRDLPNVKLIVTLRDPIERAYSQYWDNRRRLREPDRFEDLLARHSHQTFVPGLKNYFSRGVYSVYLERYFKLFPRENILVLWFSDLRRDAEQFFGQCLDFLGLERNFETEWMSRQANQRRIFLNPAFRFFFHHPKWAARLPPGVRWTMRRGREAPFKPDPISPALIEQLKSYYRPYDTQLEKLLDRPVPWRD